MTRQLVSIDAPHFNAGLIMEGDRCVKAAPILGWMVGKSRFVIRAYCKKKRWTVVVVSEFEETP
jgi:hypothetical protein